MSIRLIFTSSIITFLILSCTEDSFNIPEEDLQQYHDVDQRLWSFFETFENEALTRGLSYDLNALGVTGSIESISEDGVAGVCHFGSHIHDVTIDLNFWNNSSNRLKEFVVFHELGHCVLSRGHNEEQFNSGICKSIMRSGLGDCNDAYPSQNRNYYLNELFNKI